MQEFSKKLIERLEEQLEPNSPSCNEHNRGIQESIAIVNQLAKEYNNGWIPCEKELPPQPKENPLIDNRPVELYLVSDELEGYPFRAFWNGKIFTDGFGKVDVIAWQPLPAPYQPKGE